MMDEYVGYLEENLSDMDRVRGILQDAINNDPDFSRNDALREVLLGRTQRYPNVNLYSEMLLWLSIQQKDFRMAFMQARALDRRFRQEGELVLEVAQLSTVNEQYDIAEQAFQYILDKGEEGTYYLDALIGNLDVRFLRITSSFNYGRTELMALESDYRKALEDLGVHPNTVTLVRNLANLQAFYLGKIEESTSLLNEIINMPQVNQRVRAECRIELADILLLTGQVWDATLLYSQVDRQYRDNPLGHEARFKNARLSYFIGEFDWAKAQLDVLKAATSRLIANDAMALSLRIQDNIGFDGNTEPLIRFARAEKLVFMNRFPEALKTLDSIPGLFPSHAIVDDVLFAKAEVFLKQGELHAADSLFALVVEQYGGGLLADDALFKRAGLYERVFLDREKAMELYQQLMISYPGSLNTVAARNRFRALRGDLVN
jgi:tetratricopeptide (TPR) repeat protein